jgi:hypothetical protein
MTSGAILLEFHSALVKDGAAASLRLGRKRDHNRRAGERGRTGKVKISHVHPRLSSIA